MPAEHIHAISRLHLIAHWLLDTWQAALLLVSVLASWAIWWLRSVFVTQRKLEAFVNANTQQHTVLKDDIHSIKENVSWMKGFMEQHYNDED